MTTEQMIRDLRQLGKYSNFKPEYNYLLLASNRLEELNNEIKKLKGEILKTEDK